MVPTHSTHSTIILLSVCAQSADYSGFASEHPEQLAKAIERGIPKTLRGMIWQLM